MPQKKGRRRKRKTHSGAGAENEDADNKLPRSFVLKRGDVSPSLRDLVPDLRKMLMPHTALHLRERKRGKLKDYLSVAGKLGVSHFWLLSCTELAGYIRIGRFPHGPTLMFRIDAFSLARDIHSSQRRPVTLAPIDFKEPPLLILNNFSSGPEHVKVMASVFENMFPRLNASNVLLANVRRVILIDYDPQNEQVSMRHYSLRATPAGLSRPIRSMVVKHKVPHLAGLKDIAQIKENTHSGFVSSDSEGEGPEESQVLLSQDLGKVKRKGGRTTLRLKEVGPRLTTTLVKIEEAFCGGEVFYHAYVQRSDKEITSLKEKHENRRLEKERRRQEQEENVKRKAEKKMKRHRHVHAGETGGKEEAADENQDVERKSGSDADEEDPTTGKRQPKKRRRA